MHTNTASAIAATRRAVATRGGYLIACPCLGHGKGRGDLNPSLFIRDGERRLLVRCYAGCDPADILQALGLAGRATAGTSPASVPSPPAKPQTTTGAARRIWNMTRSIAATHAAAYLAARGLASSYPAALRFLPASERYPYPTLVAAVTDPRGRIVAVELTYLDPDAPRKADVATPRRMIGPAFGAAIHCARVSDTLGLAEGLETGLSAQRLFGIPTWAASAERLPAVILPPSVRRLVYFGDADKAGAIALAKLREAHPELEIVDRTCPRADCDWNDLLQAGFVPDRALAITP